MFDSAARNSIKLTTNLKKKRDALVEAAELAPNSLFINMVEQSVSLFNNIIREEVENAFAQVEEFDFPEFRNALLGSMEMLQEGELFKINNSGEFVSTEIGESFEREFGTLDDYSNGIELARATFYAGKKKRPYNPDKASLYWKNVIYNHRFDSESYSNTIQLRLSESGQKAPFWELLDKGVPQPLKSGKGGTPYPTSEATRFVDLAERRIDSMAETQLSLMREEDKQVIQEEIIRRQQIVDDVDKVIIMTRRDVEDFTEPQIIAELRIDNVRYFQYITGTGKLGLAKEPRFKGRRLPR